MRVPGRKEILFLTDLSSFAYAMEGYQWEVYLAQKCGSFEKQFWGYGHL
jgi:hypothetical protein